MAGAREGSAGDRPGAAGDSEPDGAHRLELALVNKRGLHARAAARFVRELEFFRAEVTVSRDGQSVDGRSIMGLLMLGAPCGSTIRLAVWGAEAESAAGALAALVRSGFGEAD